MDSVSILIFLFELLVFLFSVVIHEVSHGFVAERLGDPTARIQGRLTLNPLKHIDPIGSILVPILTTLAGFPFGWAKPVPYDPTYLKNPKSGIGKIAVVGPLSNFLIAVVLAILLRSMAFWPVLPNPFLAVFFGEVIRINILLAVFNLIPIPPLDGSKVLFSVLPATEGTYRLQATLEQYGFFIIMILIFTGGLSFIQPIIGWIFRLLVGRGFGV